MELRTLQYFLTVAREENITRASEVLHITQPTLSRQMKQLEQESVTCADLLGVPLITPSRLYVQKEISNWLGSDINKLQVVAAVNLMTHAAMFINSGIACGLTIEGAVDLFEDDKLWPSARWSRSLRLLPFWRGSVFSRLAMRRRSFWST